MIPPRKRTRKARWNLWLTVGILLLPLGMPLNTAGTESQLTEVETGAKDFVKLLDDGDFSKAVLNFDRTMKTAMPAEKLEQVWNSLIAQAGPFVEQLRTRRQETLGCDVIFVTCKFENALLDAKVVYNPQKQIAGLFFVPSQTPPERRPPSHEAHEGIEGLWLGTLKSHGVEVDIVFKISRQPGGTLTAAMDIPFQRAQDMPVDEVVFENGSLRLEIKSMWAVFEGRVEKDFSTIKGHWKQAGQMVPLTLKRVDQTPKLRRPQEPKKPYPYDEEEITFENKKAQIKLAGTLTLPRSREPVPAVLLISGSGMQDRNGTVFGHRPFLVLADYLTRQGIAVLRVDDRGMGGSGGSMVTFFQSTSEDFMVDVLSGIEYLKSRKEINPRKIGLIGHSEGGIIAPMAAVQSLDVAFIVLMGGPGLVGEEVLYSQSDLFLKAVGASDEVRAIQRAALEQMFSILKHEKDNAIAKLKIRKVMKDTLAKISDQEKEALGLSEGLVELQIKMALSPWFRFFLTYDPKPTLTKVKCPVLAIIGEKDLQAAPAKENLQAIEQALKAGGNKNFVVKELPNLNHLFQTAETGSLTEYAKIEETISPAVLKLIADWIRKLQRR